MKTDKNSRTTTAEGLSVQPERALQDTQVLQKFRVTLLMRDISRAFVTVEARTLAEAKEQAELTDLSEVHDWETFDGELVVDEVEPLSGGEDND